MEQSVFAGAIASTSAMVNGSECFVSPTPTGRILKLLHVYDRVPMLRGWVTAILMLSYRWSHLENQWAQG